MIKASLNLSQKAFLLVSIPLVFEITFVGILVSLLQQVELERKQEAHAKDIINHVNIFLRLLINTGTDFLVFTATKDPGTLKNFPSVQRGVQKELATLRKLVKDNPEETAAFLQMERTRLQINANVARTYVAVQSGNESQRLQEHLLFYNLMEKFTRETDAITRKQLEIQEVKGEAQAESRKKILLVLAAGVLFNVLLAFILTRYFSTGTISRLKILMDNTERLAHGKELLTPLSGGDEIAQLDAVFHKASDELRELEKFKTETTSMVTHELRSPLTSIQAALSVLKMGAFGELPEQAKEKIEKTEANCTRLIRLINDLLDLAKLDAGKLELKIEPLPIDLIIDESIDSISEFASKSQVTFARESTGAWVYADRERLTQVLINILSNAIKYSPDLGSSVTIKTFERGSMVEVQVIDNGCGIPKAALDKIFEPFEQGISESQKQKGTGLGLAICRDIITRHGGLIAAESDGSRGSTFWFRIPVAPKHDIETPR